ncbi:MAG: protein translocase subunit SecD [Hyphomonas sp.]|uniref:protein translocase subunit SecD n=1 Tax=Hyphomonas sp. TaxID=87 RepID=UPI001846CE68|nr:protein translocase subunit SecD [Hyphomonas sp.]MBA3069809.1 protein translocase subunit SecD [Hyphomonas sp.]MBU3919623.1 protein translocase subunit SecD [Alphaproteobacteria bacterium]MBU4062650.1 protein translocase subunit SecD [Alphaproteobacteria bacterium]MBU4164001.1 protein translocase subunit SecD [Alphaproteobacteria bacterium]
MLQFPLWKVILIVLTLAWGVVMALPNVVNMSGAPGFMPREGVNLGLDLRGGVYLEMEIRSEDVIGGRLEVFARDVRTALARTDSADPVTHLAEVNGQTMTIKLTRADEAGNFPVEAAIARIDKVNGPLEGGLAGGKTYEVTRAGPDSILVTVPENSENLMMADALAKTETIVRRRVDPDGVAEISITPSGVDRLVLEAPGEPDPERLKSLLSRDGRMTFNIVDDSPSAITAAQAGVVKPGYRLLSGPTTGDLLVRSIPEIVGSDIANASQGNDEANRPQINFRLNSNGARKFFETTRVNTNKRFAIVLDDVIMSAPNINEPIAGGNVRITGDFTMEEAQDLAAIISAGEMPAKLQFLDQRTVSATLGRDSINAGIRASVIGILLVAGFMILAYNLLGIFAVASLAANVVLIFGALSGLGATLTLPGIAGIILTIGMAVDANVLVFERIREEQQSGRSLLTSVQAGYERALSTILDANITTLIAAAILYLLGSGPVKGFAATLGIGILTSVFTAFVVTRWLTVMWIKTFKTKKLSV